MIIPLHTKGREDISSKVITANLPNAEGFFLTNKS